MGDTSGFQVESNEIGCFHFSDTVEKEMIGIIWLSTSGNTTGSNTTAFAFESSRKFTKGFR